MIKSYFGSRKIFFMLTFFSLAFFWQTGCSTVNVIAKQTPAGFDTIHKTEWTFLWGLYDKDEKVSCGTDSIICAGTNPGSEIKHRIVNGLQQVSVSTNWLYSFITVVTLGAVVPFDVEYLCISGQLQNGGTIGQVWRKKQ